MKRKENKGLEDEEARGEERSGLMPGEFGDAGDQQEERGRGVSSFKPGTEVEKTLLTARERRKRERDSEVARK